MKLIEKNAGWQSVIPFNKSCLRWVSPRLSNEEIIEWLNTAPGNKMINRFPMIRPLCHKDVFAELTKIAQSLDPESYDFIPPTFVLPGPDLVRFNEYKRAHPNATFIAKPDDGSGGDAIVLFKNLNDLPSRLQQNKITV